MLGEGVEGEIWGNRRGSFKDGLSRRANEDLGGPFRLTPIVALNPGKNRKNERKEATLTLNPKP